jgi:hypothetical protein
MRKKARARAAAINGHIYGEKENGGTSTFYVSAVPFTVLHRALMEQKQSPGLPVEVENYLETANGLAQGLLLAPVAGVLAAGLAVYKGMKGDGNNE